MADERAVEMGRAAAPQADPSAGALAYLNEALESGRGVAAVIGLGQPALTSVLQRFLRTIPRASTAHIASPSESPHAFLEAVLFDFGFEPFDSSAVDLQNLIAVYLRHERSQGRRAVIAIESAQECGPRVLEVIQELSRIDSEGEPAALIVLTGSSGLGRVLDSTPLSELASGIHDRYVLASPAAVPEPEEDTVRRDSDNGALEIIHDGRIVSRRRLAHDQVLIGRSEHNDLPLVSRYVSRHHALLVNEPDGAYIVDLKSMNGTYVNSERVQHKSLKDGDVISVGSYRLRYVHPERLKATPMVDPDHENFSDTVVMPSLSGESFGSD